MYTLNYEYVVFAHSVRALLPMKSLIKEVIGNLGIESDKLKFVQISTLYEKNNESIIVATIPRMNPTPKQIAVKYHRFMQQVGNKFVIWKINSENQKTDILTKGLQGEMFVSIRTLICGW